MSLSVPRSAGLATNLHFFLSGLAFATWGVHVPTFKRLHGLSEAEVALAMLAAGVGALVAVLWAGALVGRFGAMAALGLVAEGAMYDWSVLYLRESLASPQALAALGYAAFSVAMAIGRVAGDRARARLGAVALLRVGGTLAAIAMLAVLLIGHPAAALAGFALVGLGIANVVPVLFACASRVPGISPAHGISGVASLGYLGFLSGPPMIGAVAQVATLPVALCLVALFAAALAVLARRALPIMGDLGTGSDDKASHSVPVGQEPGPPG